MAKVRVYELARDLNLDSKQLVEKLKAGGLDVKNYMSTLDEDAAAKARDVVAGRVSEVVEEKRIKPTVIRRRKKIVDVKPEKPAVVPDEEIGKQLSDGLYSFLLEDSKVPKTVIGGVGKFIDFKKYLGVAANQGAKEVC